MIKPKQTICAIDGPTLWRGLYKADCRGVSVVGDQLPRADTRLTCGHADGDRLLVLAPYAQVASENGALSTRRQCDQRPGSRRCASRVADDDGVGGVGVRSPMAALLADAASKLLDDIFSRSADRTGRDASISSEIAATPTTCRVAIMIDDSG